MISVRTCIVLTLLVLLPGAAESQVLVSRQFGIESGLGNNTVGSMFQDSKGYLWFATAEGLSRYDGRGFVTYDTADGLPNAVVVTVAEDRWGHLWVATQSGLARLVEDTPTSKAADRFRSVTLGVTSSPARVIAAPDGALWCLTDDGLLRGYPTEQGEVAFSVIVARDRLAPDGDIRADGRGRVWAVLKDSLTDVSSTPQRSVPLPSSFSGAYTALAWDPSGRFLLGYGRELYERDDVDGASWRRVPIRLPADAAIGSIAIDPRGFVWLGTPKGIFGWRRNAYTDHPILGPVGYISSVLLDRQHNLWSTSFGHGVFKVSHDLVVTYRTEPFFGADRVIRLIDDDEGHIYGVTQSGALFDIEANAIRPLARGAPPFDSVYRRLLRDRRGRWWALSDDGLFYLDAPKLGESGWQRVGSIRPERLQNPMGPALLEDADGRLWIGGVRDALYRVDLNATRLETQPVGAFKHEGIPARMAVDRSKNLWVADRDHLWRMRAEAVESFGTRPGLPEMAPRWLYADERGWLWIGLRYGGVSVTKNPEAAEPVFENYNRSNGLRSNTVHAITADRYGRMYLATGRGLDRLDPADGHVRHYDDLGGTAASSILWMMTGRDGGIWAATDAGVVRLDPDADRAPLPPPPVYFTRVEAGGEVVPIPARSVSTVSNLEVPSLRNSLRLEFASLGFNGSERYQYRLDGVDADWSAPANTHVVDYPQLPAGRHRFMVRALNDRGVASEPAIATFRVHQVFWRTWWFMALVAGTGTTAVGFVYRQRVLRRRALERVRRQVAHDLHDEVGSGLAQIAVLSEVARSESAPGDQTFADIADVARNLRESMTDIVWAVDPRRDSLADLVVRMRQVGDHLIRSAGADFRLDAPASDALKSIEVPPDRRRQLLLIFKEAMTNIARHAGATRVTVAVEFDRRNVVLVVTDNGRGFDAASAAEGHGLRSMRQRAADLGGTLEFRSSADGTRVELRAPRQ